MQDINKALKDITDIRSQLSTGMTFQGVGPVVIVITGCLGLLTAGLQTIMPQIFAPSIEAYLITWIVTAILAASVVAVEITYRAPKHHACMSPSMVFSIIQQFLPIGASGAAIYFTLLKFTPEALWILPGLWQVLVSIGMLTAVRILPASIVWVGAWYFVAGVCVLMISSQNQDFVTYHVAPWLMGIPFAVGQFILAFVLYTSGSKLDD